MSSSTPPDSIDYSTEPVPPLTFIRTRARSRTSEWSDQISIDTVHDGNYIPADLLASRRVARLNKKGILWEHYIRERDWGANLLAQYLAQELRLEGYHCVTLARVVLDFNRLPGSSQPDADHFDRLAISEPFSSCLDHAQKSQLLAEYYDGISDGMEQMLKGKLIKLAIHTYDTCNPTQTERPEVSLVTRSHSYQLDSRLPFGIFDPLFPAVLVESTAHRMLRDRLALTLEKAGISVEHNYPYCLPDGSIEIRAQAWLFFQHVRVLFEAKYPETRGQPAYEKVWQMLLNTNLRRASSEILRGYIHRFRQPQPEQVEAFRAARDAYVAVHDFLQSHPELVPQYRMSAARPSALGIEIRKDLVWRFEGDTPLGPRRKNAGMIAAKVAEGILTYLREDLRG